MKIQWWYILIIWILFLPACKNELPEEENSIAVFYLRGEVDGEPIAYNAGDDGYYMRADYNEDTLGIRSFTGRIGLLECGNDAFCPNSVEICIREKEKVGGTHLGINDNIFLGTFNLRGPESYLFQSYKAAFTSKSHPYGVNHTWYFGDGSSSNDINPVHYFFNAGDSVVTPTLLVYNSTNGCTSQIAYDVDFTRTCSTDIVVTKIGVQHFFTATPGGRTDMWDFGNGFLPLGTGNPIPSDSIFKVCLSSTDLGTNCTAIKCENVILDSAVVGCSANYDVDWETVTLKDVRDYSEVTLKWQNDNGNVYSSDLFNQPTSSYFEVISIEDYNETLDGFPTKKITVRIKSRLFGSSESDFVDFVSEKSVIAIAYPGI